MEELPVDRCAVTAWRPDVDGIDEVFHAHIVDWGYPAHAHDTPQLHHGLVRGEETLDGEGRLALIRDRIEAHLRPTATVDVDDTRLAHRLRLLLDEHTVAPIRLADAAAVLDRSVSHLVRSFTATFGVSPHAYVVGRRIDAARGLLLDGVPPAEVATAVGFHDQAHLTRHFKRHVATTPARYARGR